MNHWLDSINLLTFSATMCSGKRASLCILFKWFVNSPEWVILKCPEHPCMKKIMLLTYRWTCLYRCWKHHPENNNKLECVPNFLTFNSKYLDIIWSKITWLEICNKDVKNIPAMQYKVKHLQPHNTLLDHSISPSM